MRLLHKLSPELLSAAFDNHIKSLSTSSELALPLGLPEDLDLESKLRRGQDETAVRALEVVVVQTLTAKDESTGGIILAGGIVRICEALASAWTSPGTWDGGLKVVVDRMRDGEL